MKIDHDNQRLHVSNRSFFIACLSVTLGLALAGVAGCEREGPGETAGKQLDQAAEKAAVKYEDAKESMGEKAAQAGEYMDDSAITGKIKMEILGDPRLKLFQINVTTTNGVVTLSGVVDSQQSIDRALDIAREVPTVRSVENGLVVKDDMRPD